MSSIFVWLEKQAPDVGATFRRFPLAIILTALGTLIFIVLINSWFEDQHEIWIRLGVGMAGGTIYALAGSLFLESRQPARVEGILVVLIAYGLPVLMVLAMQVQTMDYLSAPMLLVVSPFWLSVSAFTRIGHGPERAELQNRFWWLNHQSVTTGVVAGVGFGLICLGTVAIERSLNTLFGLHTSDIVYRLILPFAGFFLTPLYWYSTIPQLDEFEEGAIDQPDFLSRAIGFLGQFILAPILLIYALILLAYTVQIVITGELPNGLLGWMVLVFTITGAATWLVLHPRFMHQRPMVRIFRKTWFWLTIVPIALYALAVWQRVDAYGLTVERMLLIAGGLWAASLTLAYLSRRATDIRLIPALAGILFLLFGLGPWNVENVSRWSQLQRLRGAVQSAGLTSGTPNWQTHTTRQARGAFSYLWRANGGVQTLAKFFDEIGIETENDASRDQMLAALQFPEGDGDRQTFLSLTRLWDSPAVSTAGTPYMFTEFDIYPNRSTTIAWLEFVITDSALEVLRENEIVATANLTDWLALQIGETLVDPKIDFAIGEINYRIVVNQISLRNPAGEPVEIQNMRGILFASEPTATD